MHRHRLSSLGLHADDQSRHRRRPVGHAARLLHDARLAEPAGEDVLITAPHWRARPAPTRSGRATDDRGMARCPRWPTVGTAGTATNGRRAAGRHHDARRPRQGRRPRRAVARRRPTQSQRDFPALRVEEVGAASLNKAVNDQVGKDLGTAGDFSLPVTLVILLIAFGAIVAAGVPILLALSAVGVGDRPVGAGVTLRSRLGHDVERHPADGHGGRRRLLAVLRQAGARAERARGRTHLDAIEIAAETSGHSVIVSGLRRDRRR